MKLSAKSRYAARILLELAMNNTSAPMSAAILSQRTGVSVQFVEQILKPLRHSGLTQSIRGAAGGHRLARDAKDISLGEIVRLMEGGICLAVCSADSISHCEFIEGCLTRNAWLNVSRSLENGLDSITVASLTHTDPVCPKGQPGIAVAKAAQGPANEGGDKAPVKRKRPRKVKGLRR